VHSYLRVVSPRWLSSSLYSSFNTPGPLLALHQ
jgi:hypothetical protein